MSQDKPTELKEAIEVELICSDCGLPVAGKRPRTDVTRYLAETSRCQCNRAFCVDEVNEGDSFAEQSTNVGKANPEQKPRTAAIPVKVGFSLEDASGILGERFEVISFLGQGGMGSVFKVIETATGKTFAVKLLNPQLVHDEHSVKRFEQEARAAIHLTHPHLAAVYEYGLGKDDTPFLVMDYLDGITLEQLLKKEETLDRGQAIDIFIQICEAIQYAHLRGVIHRDIKPSNVMVTNPSRDIVFAKLFDFGIAKVLPNQAIDFTQDMTQTGDLFGSPLYMSPEQCKGLPLDERTDIYSLGCVMYKALCGRHPFEGKNFVDTVVRIITTDAEPLSSTGASDLDQVVVRCLSKDPDYRYRNASLLEADLECVRDGRPISKQRTSGKTTGHYKQKMLKTLLAVTVAFAGLAMSLHWLNSPPPLQVPPAAAPPGRPRNLPANPLADAPKLDSLAYTYFVQGKYKQAIPLLEFGITAYPEENSYLADNYNHLGKCYMMLKDYDKARTNYKKSLQLYRRWGNFAGSQMSEAVNDYATVLQAMGRTSDAESMLEEFKRLKNLDNIPY